MRKEQRSRLARRAATARWFRRGKGLLTLSQIRSATRKALGTRKARAFLFGSYARGDATVRSDLDIMIVVELLPKDELHENAVINGGLHSHLPLKKEIDLILTDEATFKHWKNQRGCVQHEVFRTGIRLV